MSDKARRLLGEFVEEADRVTPRPYFLERLTIEARAFLAQPEGAREAVLVEAIEKAIVEIGSTGDPLTEWAAVRTLHRALADTSPAALLAQGGACGKCRVHVLVIAEAKRHLQSVLGWVPDNDARREAARFLRMSERQVRAALAPGEEKE